MNKPEAILEMKKGNKVTHTNFSPEEWMTMNSDDEIVLEDGVVCSELEFWSWRTGLSWWTGYSLLT